MNDAVKYGLESFEMLDKNGQTTGLVTVDSPDKIDFLKHSTEEIIAIENAFTYGADYIYFRRFVDRPSIPQVYIYDYTSLKSLSDEHLIKLHQRLYSSGRVPMFFVFSNKDVRIFNCYEKPARGNDLIYKPLTTIKLASEVSNLFGIKEISEIQKYKAFSGRSIDNGSFWENSPFSKKFQFTNSAYEKLLIELKQALKDIIERKILPASIARKIMVISILVKYLEERTDEYNNSVFPKAGEERISIINNKKQKIKYAKSFFDQFSKGAVCFNDILKKKGAALKLLNYLANHFNGGVFKLNSKEIEVLKKTDLSRFALFLDGKLEGVQFVFWRLYSFNDLPVELISNIYEEFLEKKPGVVYTPPYLVSFLLDEAMPLKDNETNFKLLDPSCGSGVFLVGAYRRLIYRWRKQNNWKRPNLILLKKLLKDNIYGSDKDPEAVNLTIFSLSLALCDELTPLEIWEKLEFDDLTEENIFSDDFFSLLQDKFLSGYFDLVIGNPPFEAKLTASAKKIENEKVKERTLLTNSHGKDKEIQVKLPDNQIALLFLEQSISLCKPGGLVCLIQPSGPFLYNNRSLQFRQVLLINFNIPQIIDFTHLSRVLFGKSGDVPTAAVFIKNEKACDKGLLHLLVRRTRPNKEKIYFELDTYDFYHVPRQLALNDPFIWKSNFLGGSRFHQIIKRLRDLETLKTFLRNKTQKRGWAYGEGFIQGKIDEIGLFESLLDKKKLSSNESSRLNELQKKYKLAKHIVGKPLFSSQQFYSDFVPRKAIRNTESYYRYASNEKLFTPPHILIKEEIKDDRIPMVLNYDYATFKHRIVGIHAPEKDKWELENLFKYLQSDLIIFYLAGTSSEYMINRSSSFLKKDIDNIPYAPNSLDLLLSEYDNILLEDFSKYLIEFRRNGETSNIAVQDASKKDLQLFSEVFCGVLNSVYSTLQSYTPFETDSYICCPFYFKNKPVIHFDNAENAEKDIENLVKKISGISLRLTRVVRIYDQNVIYLIKPKKLRYWLRSIALRDADETFSDLRKQGF